MTYNSRPMHGIKESFYGPAAYREAEYQQSTKPQPAQSLAVGDSKTKPTIEGFEKTIYPQPGTKQELMGAGVVAYAQAFETWVEEEKAYRRCTPAGSRLPSATRPGFRWRTA